MAFMNTTSLLSTRKNQRLCWLQSTLQWLAEEIFASYKCGTSSFVTVCIVKSAFNYKKLFSKLISLAVPFSFSSTEYFPRGVYLDFRRVTALPHFSQLISLIVFGK